MKVYLQSFPKDATLDLVIEEADLKANKVCLLVRSELDFDWRVIKGVFSNNSIKFQPAQWCSSIEHAIGEQLNFLKDYKYST